MKKVELIQVGNPILRAQARKVINPRSSAIQSLIKKLTAVMRTHDLVGISAPQIGIAQCVFLSEIRKTKARPRATQDALRVYINPRIVAASKLSKSLYEGCGSVLDGALFAQVVRHVWVTITYTDTNGLTKTETLRGLSAHIAQHEIDHLNGILFLDRVVNTRSYITRELFKKKRNSR